MSRAGELRKDSWVEVADVLFIDNPVGTGFSYVLNGSNFTHNNDDIAADLLTFLSRFVQDHPERQSTPLYIFSESYGGKMAIGFAKAIIGARQAGQLKVNFKAVALGDSWISPMDFVRSYSPFLKAWSLIDEHFEKELNVIADQAQEALDRGAFESATAVWGAQQAAVANVTDNVDWCTPACAELTDDNNSPACHNAAFRDEHLVAQYLALRHRYNALLHDPEDSASAAASRWLSNSHIAGRQALQAPSLC